MNMINELYQIDPTITSFTLDVSNEKFIEKDKEENFKEIIEILTKSTEDRIMIPTNKEQEKLFHIIQYLLGEEEDIKIMTSIDESLSYLTTKFHIHSIEYLSGHFTEFIESGKTKKIEESIMKEIIDAYFINKKVENSDENKKIFTKMVENDEETGIILYFILNLDIEEYNKDIQTFFYENLDDKLFETEFSRIIYIIRTNLLKLIGINESSKSNRTRNERIIECEFSGDELSGIISRLMKNKTPDEVLKNEIQLTGGGDFNPSYPIANLIKYDSNHKNDCYYNWKSNRPTEENSWIIFDFGERRVNLSSYTIRSNQCILNSHSHPKSWTICGSNDEENWDVINQQTNNSSLNGKYKQNRFECEKNNNFYRYIRYKQDDSWDSDNRYRYAVYLSCIELFGSISIPVN